MDSVVDVHAARGNDDVRVGVESGRDPTVLLERPMENRLLLGIGEEKIRHEACDVAFCLMGDGPDLFRFFSMPASTYSWQRSKDTPASSMSFLVIMLLSECFVSWLMTW